MQEIKEENNKKITLLERLMIATETTKTALLRTVNEISPNTLKKWQIDRILEGKDEPLSLIQVKLVAVALGVDYTELISGAAGYTGIKIKNIDQQKQIKNQFVRRKTNVSDKNAKQKNTKC